MNWENQRVLVTGAGGFIGSHLVEMLLQRGARVRALLRYTAKRELGHLKEVQKDWGNSLEFCFGDVRDAQSAESALEKIDVVFHLAAVISIPYSLLHPADVVEVNAMGTLQILEAARKQKQGARRIVITSTSEVYGSAQVSPMTEKHPLSPQSPYAASKMAADALAQSYYRSYQLPVAVIRPFNTFGPRQSDRAVIPAIIAQALWREQIVLGDLRPERDFTFVTDTVEGFLLAARRPAAVGRVIHLGTGQTFSVGRVVNLVQKILGTRKRVVFSAQRRRPPSSEVKRLISSPVLAGRLLSWKAAVPFEEGLRQTIEWIRDHPDQYHPDAYRI